MVNNLTMAWATPVDTVKLGARLEAYVDTKSAVLTLRLCIPYAPSGCYLAKLSPEVIGIIGTQVQDAVFETLRPSWELAWECCQDTCSSHDHQREGWYNEPVIEEPTICMTPWDNKNYPEYARRIVFKTSSRGSDQERATHHHRVSILLEGLGQQTGNTKDDQRFVLCREVRTSGVVANSID